MLLEPLTRRVGSTNIQRPARFRVQVWPAKILLSLVARCGLNCSPGVEDLENPLRRQWTGWSDTKYIEVFRVLGARISSTRHIAAPPCLIGLGKRPDLIPAYQVALPTGINPRVAGRPLAAPRPSMSQMRKKPSTGKSQVAAAVGAGAGVSPETAGAI